MFCREPLKWGTIAAGAALALVLLLTKPASADDRCSMDFNSDTYIDISDVTQLTQRFGEPHGAPYDIHPELTGNGYVDISDISFTTQYFGSQCFGITSDEVMGDSVSASTFNCEYQGYSWLVARTPNYIVVGGHNGGAWYGITACQGSNPEWQYTTDCQFGIYGYEPSNPTPWQPKATTFLAQNQMGLYCGANSWQPAYISRCQPFKFGMSHWVEHYGVPIHGDFHVNDNHYAIC